MSTNNNAVWDNDLVQFARLLSEINATQNDIDFHTLSDEMNCSIAEVEELFDRADAVWEKAKQDTISKVF